MRRLPFGASSANSSMNLPLSSKSSCGLQLFIHASRILRCSGFSRTVARGTWCARNVPSIGIPSTSFGQVHPYGRAKNNHGPDRLLLEPTAARLLLNCSNLGVAIVQRSSEELMHGLRIVAFDKIGPVTTSDIQSFQFFVARPSLNSRPGDFVAVEVEDREDCAVSHWIEEVD